MQQPSLFNDLPAKPAAVQPAVFDPALRTLGQALPDSLYLGTSSWAFPGWEGLVYGQAYAESLLSREGLRAYAQHPLFRTVSLDRTFYAPMSREAFAGLAAQTPDDFRFMVKCPARITDALLRGAQGQARTANPDFLNAELALQQFIAPCLEGLAHRAGPLVFQMPPLPAALLAYVPAMVERLGRFFDALPPLPYQFARSQAFYTVEFRDPTLLTPRMMKQLQACGVRYCLAVHDRMPEAARQLQALASQGPGPLVIRWSLLSGQRYEAAKARFAPFNRLQVEDLASRETLAAAARQYLRQGETVWLAANNKAEGSSPLTLRKWTESLLDRPPETTLSLP